MEPRDSGPEVRVSLCIAGTIVAWADAVELIRQVSRDDVVLVSQGEGAFDDVVKFSDIAGPPILLQQLEGSWAEASGWAVIGICHLEQEVISQSFDVQFSLAKWRNLDIDDIDAVVQVIAKLSLLDELLDRGVGSCHHSRTNWNGSRGSEWGDFLLLERTK